MTALGESTYEAVFDHGGNGYGVWFDGVVRGMRETLLWDRVLSADT